MNFKKSAFTLIEAIGAIILASLCFLPVVSSVNKASVQTKDFAHSDRLKRLTRNIYNEGLAAHSVSGGVPPSQHIYYYLGYYDSADTNPILLKRAQKDKIEPAVPNGSIDYWSGGSYSRADASEETSFPLDSAVLTKDNTIAIYHVNTSTYEKVEYISDSISDGIYIPGTALPSEYVNYSSLDGTGVSPVELENILSLNVEGKVCWEADGQETNFAPVSYSVLLNIPKSTYKPYIYVGVYTKPNESNRSWRILKIDPLRGEQITESDIVSSSDMTGDIGYPLNIAVSPDGKHIVAQTNNKVLVYNDRLGSPAAKFNMMLPAADPPAKEWQSGKNVMNTVRRYGGVAFRPDGKYCFVPFYCASDSVHFLVIDFSKIIDEPNGNHEPAAFAIDFKSGPAVSFPEDYVCFAGHDGNLYFSLGDKIYRLPMYMPWNPGVANGNLVVEMKLDSLEYIALPGSRKALAADMTADGQTIYILARGTGPSEKEHKYLFIYDARSLRQLHESPTPIPKNAAESMTFSGDSRLLAFAPFTVFNASSVDVFKVYDLLNTQKNINPNYFSSPPSPLSLDSWPNPESNRDCNYFRYYKDERLHFDGSHADSVWIPEMNTFVVALADPIAATANTRQGGISVKGEACRRLHYYTLVEQVRGDKNAYSRLKETKVKLADGTVVEPHMALQIEKDEYFSAIATARPRNTLAYTSFKGGTEKQAYASFLNISQAVPEAKETYWRENDADQNLFVKAPGARPVWANEILKYSFTYNGINSDDGAYDKNLSKTYLSPTGHYYSFNVSNGLAQTAADKQRSLHKLVNHAQSFVNYVTEADSTKKPDSIIDNRTYVDALSTGLTFLNDGLAVLYPEIGDPGILKGLFPSFWVAEFHRKKAFGKYDDWQYNGIYGAVNRIIDRNLENYYPGMGQNGSDNRFIIDRVLMTKNDSGPTWFSACTAALRKGGAMLLNLRLKDGYGADEIDEGGGSQIDYIGRFPRDYKEPELRSVNRPFATWTNVSTGSVVQEGDLLRVPDVGFGGWDSAYKHEARLVVVQNSLAVGNVVEKMEFTRSKWSSGRNSRWVFEDVPRLIYPVILEVQEPGDQVKKVYDYADPILVSPNYINYNIPLTWRKNGGKIPASPSRKYQAGWFRFARVRYWRRTGSRYSNIYLPLFSDPPTPSVTMDGYSWQYDSANYYDELDDLRKVGVISKNSKGGNSDFKIYSPSVNNQTEFDNILNGSNLNCDPLGNILKLQANFILKSSAGTVAPVEKNFPPAYARKLALSADDMLLAIMALEKDDAGNTQPKIYFYDMANIDFGDKTEIKGVLKHHKNVNGQAAAYKYSSASTSGHELSYDNLCETDSGANKNSSNIFSAFSFLNKKGGGYSYETSYLRYKLTPFAFRSSLDRSDRNKLEYTNLTGYLMAPFNRDISGFNLDSPDGSNNTNLARPSNIIFFDKDSHLKIGKEQGNDLNSGNFKMSKTSMAPFQYMVTRQNEFYRANFFDNTTNIHRLFAADPHAKSSWLGTTKWAQAGARKFLFENDDSGSEETKYTNYPMGTAWSKVFNFKPILIKELAFDISAAPISATSYLAQNSLDLHKISFIFDRDTSNPLLLAAMPVSAASGKTLIIGVLPNSMYYKTALVDCDEDSLTVTSDGTELAVTEAKQVKLYQIAEIKKALKGSDEDFAKVFKGPYGDGDKKPRVWSPSADYEGDKASLASLPFNQIKTSPPNGKATLLGNNTDSTAASPIADLTLSGKLAGAALAEGGLYLATENTEDGKSLGRIYKLKFENGGFSYDENPFAVTPGAAIAAMDDYVYAFGGEARRYNPDPAADLTSTITRYSAEVSSYDIKRWGDSAANRNGSYTDLRISHIVPNARDSSDTHYLALPLPYSLYRGGFHGEGEAGNNNTQINSYVQVKNSENQPNDLLNNQKSIANAEGHVAAVFCGHDKCLNDLAPSTSCKNYINLGNHQIDRFTYGSQKESHAYCFNRIYFRSERNQVKTIEIDTSATTNDDNFIRYPYRESHSDNQFKYEKSRGQDVGTSESTGTTPGYVTTIPVEPKLQKFTRFQNSSSGTEHIYEMQLWLAGVKRLIPQYLSVANSSGAKAVLKGTAGDLEVTIERADDENTDISASDLLKMFNRQPHLENLGYAGRKGDTENSFFWSKLDDEVFIDSSTSWLTGGKPYPDSAGVSYDKPLVIDFKFNKPVKPDIVCVWIDVNDKELEVDFGYPDPTDLTDPKKIASKLKFGSLKEENVKYLFKKPDETGRSNAKYQTFFVNDPALLSSTHFRLKLKEDSSNTKIMQIGLFQREENKNTKIKRDSDNWKEYSGFKGSSCVTPYGIFLAGKSYGEDQMLYSDTNLPADNYTALFWPHAVQSSESGQNSERGVFREVRNGNVGYHPGNPGTNFPLCYSDEVVYSARGSDLYVYNIGTDNAADMNSWKQHANIFPADSTIDSTSAMCALNGEIFIFNAPGKDNFAVRKTAMSGLSSGFTYKSFSVRTLPSPVKIADVPNFKRVYAVPCGSQIYVIYYCDTQNMADPNRFTAKIYSYTP